jgi:hypothetical protein
MAFSFASTLIEQLSGSNEDFSTSKYLRDIETRYFAATLQLSLYTNVERADTKIETRPFMMLSHMDNK